MSSKSNPLAYVIATVNVIVLAKVWLGSLAFPNDVDYQITGTRWIIAFALPIVLALYGYGRKSVNLSGSIYGALVGHSMFLSSYCVGLALLTCFFATSYSTRWKRKIKSGHEVELESERRNWIQVASNVGFSAVLILLRLELFASGEFVIDFNGESFWSSALLIAALAGIASALGDTMSSELGPLSNEEPILITNPMKNVPKGTNGGVTITGLVAATLGGLLIGVTAFVSQVAFLGVVQWAVILFCVYAGLIGSTIDSVLGATLQYSGYDHLKRRIVEHSCESSSYVEHLSGLSVLNNHEVNLISVALTSLLCALLSSLFWPGGGELFNL